jgi:polyphosphate kinase
MNAHPATHFISRELSWLEFNQRVLEEALDVRNPLLERVKFFSIVSSNLDEFFEVRVAGVKQQIESNLVERSMDGRTATETLRAIRERVKRMVGDQFECWRSDLVPKLAKENIRFLRPEELEGERKAWLDRYYEEEVRPVLTPLGIDPAHPFPQLLNKSLNIILQLEVVNERTATDRQGERAAERRGESAGDPTAAGSGRAGRRLAVVQVPKVLPRLVRLPGPEEQRDYVFLGSLICHYLADLFPGTQILGYWHFRLTRNSELYIDEDDTRNLLSAVEQELHNRRRGAAVRLEVDHTTPQEICHYLMDNLDLDEGDVYRIDGPLNPVRLMAVCAGDHSPELRDPPFVAPAGAAVRDAENLFEVIREQDVLLHHPYESFSTVVDFLEQAATDPQVLAIKQTLYRTGGDARVVGALMSAVRNGKQVTAVTELKARFDEANNILWARRLEEVGVHVVYGMVHHKVHSKMTLVIRKDEDRIRGYLHLGTGNYNPSTAKLYTDISFFTSNPAFVEDTTKLFNLLTGIGRFQGASKLLIAPFTLHDEILRLVTQETLRAKAGKPARIIAKMNGLVDRELIEAMYEASNAGVQIDLIVRGICCLRPGLPGVSENIRVRSIIGRFLEHSRIYYFENGGDPLVYAGSADWMPRNFYSRVEAVFPIEDPELKDRVVHEILGRMLQDDTKAWELRTDALYRRCGTPIKHSGLPAKPAHHSQKEFMDLAVGRKRKRSTHQPEQAAAKAPKQIKPLKAVKSQKTVRRKKTAGPLKARLK